jgi:hypothetical protein
MRQYTVVRAGIDHRRSNNDCNYKAAHDFLRQFGKCFAGMITKQRLRTTRTDRRSRYVYFQVQARRIAAGIARLPELLRAQQSDANALVQRR